MQHNEANVKISLFHCYLNKQLWFNIIGLKLNKIKAFKIYGSFPFVLNTLQNSHYAI